MTRTRWRLCPRQKDDIKVTERKLASQPSQQLGRPGVDVAWDLEREDGVQMLLLGKPPEPSGRAA